MFTLCVCMWSILLLCSFTATALVSFNGSNQNPDNNVAIHSSTLFFFSLDWNVQKMKQKTIQFEHSAVDVFHRFPFGLVTKSKWTVIGCSIFQNVMSSTGKCLPLKVFQYERSRISTHVTLLSSSSASDRNKNATKPRHCYSTTVLYARRLHLFWHTNSIRCWMENTRCAHNFPTRTHATEKSLKTFTIEWIHLQKISCLKKKTCYRLYARGRHIEIFVLVW